jgi:hypothetical protein
VTRQSLRVACALLTLAPLALALDAPRVADAFHEAEPTISPWLATRILPFAAAYFFAYPFFLDHLFHRPTSRIRLRGGNPDEVSLLNGVASSCSVGATAFVLLMLAAVSTHHVYLYATLSFAASLYWCWRYANLLR